MLACFFFAIFSVYMSKKHCTGACQNMDHNSIMHRKKNNPMHEKALFWEKCHEEHLCPYVTPNQGYTKCENGFAGEYPCNNMDLLSFVNLNSLGSSGNGNDVWGWVDPETKREYVLAAEFDGTSFLDVTTPSNPSVLGYLPTHTTGSSWRDIKVYKNHAYIISEAYNHGMQIFDLTQLRTAPRIPVQFGVNFSTSKIPKFKESAFYGEFGSCHNIAINEETGFAYAVGTQTCTSGLHIVDIRDPKNPEFAGCYAGDGYVHDTQCVVYQGPDSEYVGKEICFCYDEDTLTIVDVSDKDSIALISRTPYEDSQYTHQGWLLKDSRHLLLNDELDELNGREKTTRTLIWDIVSLKRPQFKASYFAKKSRD